MFSKFFIKLLPEPTCLSDKLIIIGNYRPVTPFISFFMTQLSTEEIQKKQAIHFNGWSNEYPQPSLGKINPIMSSVQ